MASGFAFPHLLRDFFTFQATLEPEVEDRPQTSTPDMQWGMMSNASSSFF
jgi:hypothetical protein